MSFWTYLLIGFAVSALLGYMRKPKEPKGQTVALPALMAVIGGIAGVFFGGLTVWAAMDDAGIFERSVFLLFALLGVGMVLAYVNCRIHYDKQGFTVKNLWGITRSYTYDDITWLKGTKDVKLYVGERVVRIDEMAVGKTEFLCHAEARYRKTHGGRGIPIKPPNGKRNFDLFNGNVENPGEFIAVYAVLMAYVLFSLGLMVYTFVPPEAEDLTYSTVQVERYEVEENTLWLYANEEKLPYDIWQYTTSLEDAEEFLQLCEKGEPITLGYLSYSEHHKVHYAEDARGTVYLTMEAAQEAERPNNQKAFLCIGGMALIMLLLIAASIYVGRHPERVGPRVVRLFFKEGYVHMPENRKKR